jgi:lipid II:glycine glycyltransferase (peptidoglycan interpeptide bridge formation enzyme)
VLTELTNAGYQNENWSLHSTKTIVLDLRKSDQDLLSDMEKDTRYSIRASQRRGIRVVKSSNLERFLKLYRATAKRQKFWIPEKDLKTLWDIFDNEGKSMILIAVWNRTDVAGCLLLHHQNKAYYYHAASLREYKEFFAPYLLIWESMQYSKSLGLKELDLEGVYDHRFPSTNKWKGFTHFKRGFAGEEVELLGSFVKHYHPLFSTFHKVSQLKLSF